MLYLPRALLPNCPEFPDSWSGGDLALLVNVDEVLIHGLDRDLVEISKRVSGLKLGQA
jgi:hypothetical protein